MASECGPIRSRGRGMNQVKYERRHPACEHDTADSWRSTEKAGLL